MEFVLVEYKMQKRWEMRHAVGKNWGMLLQWRHNERYGVSNHQRLHCLLNHLFGRRSKKTSKLRFTGLYTGNSPVTCEFPAQKASNAENISIWWRHHEVVDLIQQLLTLPCWPTHTRSAHWIALVTNSKWEIGYRQGGWQTCGPTDGQFTPRIIRTVPAVWFAVV